MQRKKAVNPPFNWKNSLCRTRHLSLEASCSSLHSCWNLQHIWQPRVMGEGGDTP